MAKKEPNILFSTNCLLAYQISREYYNNLHYVWCSTIFGSPGVDDPLRRNPRSSAPYERYSELKKDTASIGDIHSSMITSQRAGIKNGAQAKLNAGEITSEERDEILEIVDATETSQFEPLMYLIPFEKVKTIAKKVPVSKRANPLSDEWVIEALPRDYFEIIQF